MTTTPAWGALVRWPNGVQGLLLATIRESEERAHGALAQYNETTRRDPVQLLRVVPIIITYPSP